MKINTLKEHIETFKSDTKRYLNAIRLGDKLGILDLKCKFEQEISDNSLEEELTIYFNPIQYENQYINLKYNRQFIGYIREEIAKSYKKVNGKNIFPINIKDFGGKKSLIIGYYLKSKNILFFGINPFGRYVYGWCIFKFYDMIKSLLKQTNIEVQDIKDEQMKILSKNFLSGVKNRINDIEEEIENGANWIKEKNIEIIKILKNIQSNEILIEGLRENIENKENGFLDELKKLDNLSYLDKWEIKGTNLIFYFKNVHAMFQGENVYLGEYRVSLLANGQFKWECKNKITNLYTFKGDKSIHPHIRGNDELGQCWGDKGNSVRDAVKNGNYTLIVSYINMFLRTYNQNSPHRKIENWILFNKKNNRSAKNPMIDEDIKW